MTWGDGHHVVCAELMRLIFFNKNLCHVTKIHGLFANLRSSRSSWLRLHWKMLIGNQNDGQASLKLSRVSLCSLTSPPIAECSTWTNIIKKDPRKLVLPRSQKARRWQSHWHLCKSFLEIDMIRPMLESSEEAFGRPFTGPKTLNCSLTNNNI